MSISTPSNVRLIRNDDGQRHHYVSIGHQQIVCSDLGITVTVHLTLMLDGVSFQGCSPVHLICPAMPVEAQRNSRHPVPRRGALAIVTNVGTGCGGRGSVGRERCSQGGSSVSGHRAQTNGA